MTDPPIVMQPFNVEQEKNAFNRESDRLFFEFIIESGIDTRLFTHSQSFEKYIRHLNENARLPQLDIHEMMEFEEEDIKKETDEETIVEETPSMDRPYPCTVCHTSIYRHESIKLTPSDAIKVLMACVIMNPFHDKSEETVLMSYNPLWMCRKHNDEVFEWMRDAIGARYESDIDTAPTELLEKALAVYKRLKVFREKHEGKTPRNPSMGAFKMAMKTYFRNFVPLRGSVAFLKNAKKAEEYNRMKQAPVKQPLRKFLQEEKMNLTPNEELNLFASINAPRRRVPRARRSGTGPFDPLAIYADAAIDAVKRQMAEGPGCSNQSARDMQVTVDPIDVKKPISAEIPSTAPDARKFMRVVSKPIAGAWPQGRGKFVPRPQPTVTVHIKENPEQTVDLVKQEPQDDFDEFTMAVEQGSDINNAPGSLATNGAGVVRYPVGQEQLREVKEELDSAPEDNTDDLVNEALLKIKEEEPNDLPPPEHKPEDLLQMPSSSRLSRTKRRHGGIEEQKPKRYQTEEKKKVYHLDLRAKNAAKKDAATILVTKEIKQEPMVLDLRSKKKSTDGNINDQ